MKSRIRTYIGLSVVFFILMMGIYQPNVIYGESDENDLGYIEYCLIEWKNGDLPDSQLCMEARSDLSYRFGIETQLGTIQAGVENGFDIHAIEVMEARLSDLYEKYGAEELLDLSMPRYCYAFSLDRSATTITVDPSVLELTKHGIMRVNVLVFDDVFEGFKVEIDLEALRPDLEEGTFEIQVNKMNRNQDMEFCIFDPVSFDIVRGEKDITLREPIKLIYFATDLSLYDGDCILMKNGVGDQLIKNEEFMHTIECDIQESLVYQLDFAEKNYAFQDLSQLKALERIAIQEMMSMELIHGINNWQFRPLAVMTYGEYQELLSQFTDETMYYEHVDDLNFYEAMRITAEYLRSFGLEEPKESTKLYISDNTNTDGFSLQEIQDLRFLEYNSVCLRAMYQEDVTFESDFTRMDAAVVLKDIVDKIKNGEIDVPINVLGERFVYNYEALVLHDLGLFDGVSEGSFVPDLFGTVNREQALKMIGVALDWDIDPNSVSKFEDVSNGAQPYVKKAYELGITNGISDTQFGSQNEVTGKEVFTWLIRGLGIDSEEAWKNTEKYVFEDFNLHVIYSPEYAYNRNLMVKAIYEVLEKTPLDSESTLIQKLVEHYPSLKEVAEHHFPRS